MFTGLSAFPLTPLHNDAVDERSFIGLIERLVGANVDSITALGSTGSYAYLSSREREHVARLAVEHADGIPVLIGVSALRTSHVLAHIDAAASAGAAGVLLAPMTYQPLTTDDVYELFRTVTEHTDLPVVLYDNPRTTHFSFTLDLYAQIAELPGIASIKIPGVPADPQEARAHVARIREKIPQHVTIGVSGDASAATGLSAGCDAWYSVIGGTLPALATRITRLAAQDDALAASAASERLAPLWSLFADIGSLRVIAEIAEQLGLAQRDCLPLPLQRLNETERARIAALITELDVQG